MSVINESEKQRRVLSIGEMVNTYEVLCELKESGVLHELLKKGIVAITYLDFMSIYETFNKFMDTGIGKMESYHMTGIEHNVHYRSVMYAIKKMEG